MYGQDSPDKSKKKDACQTCREGFDESVLFQSPFAYSVLDMQELSDEFRMKFMNLSSLMDCVGCQKVCCSLVLFEG